MFNTHGHMSLSPPCGLINLYSEYFLLDPLVFTKRVKHASIIRVTKPHVFYFSACFEILTENT